MMNPEGGLVTTGHNHGDMAMDVSEMQENSMQQPTVGISQTFSIDNTAKEAFLPLYESYLNWKDALTNDSFEEAQRMATNMKSALEGINMSLFKGDAHNAWMDYQGSVNSSLEHVQHLSDIEQLRKAFQSVSAIMIEMTTAFKPLGEAIYVQHCPMADNNNGADWLSTEKEIRNPYFGSSMLTCGEVTREIN